MSTQTATTWKMKGTVIGACSCDWGCPCNFDARPTQGWCHGNYNFFVEQGNSNGVSLDGAGFALAAEIPGAVHEGNIRALPILDEKLTPAQMEALGPILGGGLGGPFAILASLITEQLDPQVVAVDWKLDGPNSRVKWGEILEVELEMIKNPVTGEESGFTLDFSNGLLTDSAELMTTRAFRLSHPEMSYDHSGQYGELFRFDYSGGSI
ncbi:MAG: DUF1326 domain-containing protein [Dehalococcoidia bacterium]|nr:DUF1326 domain-containing protein [Dehalococcoidia bacterium]